MEKFLHHDAERPGSGASESSGNDARRLRLALDISRLGTWTLDPETRQIDWDARMLEMWGEAPGRGLAGLEDAMERIHPADRPAVDAVLAEALDPKGSGKYSITFRVIHDDGQSRWITTIGQAEFVGEGKHRRVAKLLGTARDSTEEKQSRDLLLAQQKLLVRIARGEPLAEILRAIVEVVEEQSGGRAVGQVMLVDQQSRSLRHGAATRLPQDYIDRIDGIRIDPGTGTCAAAAALDEMVVTPDFRSDPRWAGLGELPLALGFQGAWSMPIRGNDGRVLGTLGTYFFEVRRPEEREIRIVAVLAETAALAIEKLEARRKLEVVKREALHRQGLYEAVVTHTPDLIYVFDLQHRFTYANPALLRMWGITWDEARGKTCLELGYPRWHAEMHDRELEEVVRTRKSVKGEVPYVGGQGRQIIEYIFSPVLGADGTVEAIAGTSRDVTVRKRAEEHALFLSGLTKRLASLSSEADVVAEAVEATGKFLGVQRCCFAEYLADRNEVVVGPNWLRDPDTLPLEGSFDLSDPGSFARWERYSSGDFVVHDVREDDLTRELAPAYERMLLRSFAVQPFKRGGRHTVVLAVTEDRPRRWTDDELALMESVISRTWPLVERIRMETELRESEEHLSLIANHAPALISYLDRDCRYRFVNDHYVQWFGRPREEIIGCHVREVLGEEIYEQRLPFLERVLAGEPVRTQGPAVHVELGVRDLEVALVPYNCDSGETMGFFVMGFDVTEHRRARQSLVERGERLRLLWESASILLTTDDPETMLRRLFEGIGNHLGADTYFNFAVEDGGSSLRLRSWCGISDDEAREILTMKPGQGLCGVVANGRTPVIVPGSVMGVHRATPEQFGLKCYAGYPLIKEDRVFGTLAFASRTREAFSADELEFLETIRHYVTAAYVRLELVSSLREGDRRKDEFLATLAHELRNPLAPIRTGVEVLKQMTDPSGPAAPVIGIIERQTAQMVRLIDDLIDVSRITRGKLELRTGTLDLREVLSVATEAVQPLIDRHGHDFRGPEAGGPILVHGDASRLSQVFSNLLGNAARYTPPGGRIRLAVETTAGEVTVTVEDNGEGIEAEMQEHIFEMFTQINRPAGSSTDGGLGIGLTLVRLLVDMHGGWIRVHSEGAGKGSTFRVTLPRAARGETPSAPAAREPELPGNVRCKILVVDDGAAAADMLAMFLAMEGFETSAAYSGGEALETAARQVPRVAFIDIGMPGMDGLETARRMRRVPGCEDAILIALTGWGQEDDRKKTREAGFDHHLVKPAEPAALRALLGRLDLSSRDS